MRKTSSATFILAAALLGATSSHAQTSLPRAESPSPGVLGIAPFAGYLISEPLVEGPLSTSVGGANAPVYGAQLSVPLFASVSLVGTVGYASGDLDVGVPLIGGISVGDSKTWLFDGGLELRPDSWQESGSRFIPVVQLGGGALRRELNVAGIAATSTDFVVSGGIGADIPIGPNVAIRMMAKDHYGKADFGSIGVISARTEGIHTLALSGGLRMSF